MFRTVSTILKTSGIRRPVRSAFLVWCLLLPAVGQYGMADEVRLEVRPGDTPDAVILIFDQEILTTGSNPAQAQYEIFKSTAPDSVVDPSNKLAETSGTEWVDRTTTTSPI